MAGCCTVPSCVGEIRATSRLLASNPAPSRPSRRPDGVTQIHMVRNAPGSAGPSSLTCAASSTTSDSAAAAATPISPASGPAEVRAVLFDMDGVLCNSEIVSRKAAAEVMAELYGLTVSPDEFIPFTGTGEANFLGGVARKYGAPFEVESCKAKFFEIYMAKYAVPGAGIGYPGARDLVQACRAAGLRTAVASSADLVKVHANLGAADIPLDIFDAIVSADAFERLKPFPDIFLAAAAQLGVDPANCVVIEDAVAGVEAARAAGMRVIGVTTTLAESAMLEAAPDAVLPKISDIVLEKVQRLELRPGAEEAIAAAKAKAGASQADSNDCSTPQNSTTTSGQPRSPPFPTNSANEGVQGWLNEYVSLPAGYKTTRRDALKFASLGAAGVSLWVALTRAKGDASFRRLVLRFHLPILIQFGIVAYVALAWQYWTKSLSYASPKALLNALLPQATPFALSSSQQPTSRIAAFKRFISDLEARGGGDPVPPFPPNADWLNAPPLRFDRELRGKVVVLDFWTYCCINCMHILPDLAYLEGKYASQPVAVVGVHSAKFDNEQDTDAIRSAVLRYDIRHPVVNDRGMTLWRALGVSSWPTLAVLSPQGRLIVSLPGEGHRQDLDDILAAALEYYGEQGMLDTSPVPSALERDRDPRLAASPLRFPGKVAVDEIGARLFISDSGNHRVVVTDLGGKFLEAVGGNGPGLRDGAFSDAAFNRPQGLAYSAAKGVLYVCDTESHAVRAVDFKQRSVRTVAGNGAKGDDYQGGRSGAAQQLNSPWDCALVSTAQRSSGSATEVLYVAMAGQHQIWAVHPDTGRAQNFSGTGNERNQNGPGPLTTSWAQPSGLALLPGTATLFVADSESSSVRKLDLATGGSSACAGGDPLFSDNLFKFGDVDGIGAGALLQHPLAVAVSHDGTAVYVADSYNHRIKRLDPGTCAVTSLAGSGRAGFQDGQGANAHFSEPGGLAVASDGRLFVADTNNGVIRVFNPSKKAVSTLKLAGVPPPRVSPDAAPAWAGEAADLPPGATLVKAQTPVRPGSGRINIKIALPAGYHLTEGANSRFECAAATPDGTSLGSVSFDPVKGPLKEDGKGGVTAAVGYATAEPGMLRVLCTVYFCQDRSVCLFEEVAFEVEVREGGADGNDVELGYQLSAKAPVVDLP